MVLEDKRRMFGSHLSRKGCLCFLRGVILCGKQMPLATIAGCSLRSSLTCASLSPVQGGSQEEMLKGISLGLLVCCRISLFV